MFRKMFVIFLLTSVFSCSRTDYYDLLSLRSINRFYFSSLSNGLPGYDTDAYFDKKSNQYVVVFPKETLPSAGSAINMVPSFDIDGYALYFDGERQISGSNGLDLFDGQSYVYTVFSYDGKSTDYTVKTQNAAAWFTSFGFKATDNIALGSSYYNIGDILVPESQIEGNAIWFDLPHQISLNGLVASFATEPAGVRVCYVDNNGDEHWESKAARDYSDFCVFRVYDNRDESYLDYRVAGYRLKSLTFIGHPGIEAYLTDNDVSDGINNINVELAYGTDLKKLIPVFEISGDSADFLNSAGTKIDVVSGETIVNFEKPVDIVVKTRGGKSKHYRVNVSCTSAPAVNPYNPVNDPLRPDGTLTESGASVSRPGVPKIKEVNVNNSSISVVLDNNDQNLTGIILQVKNGADQFETDLSAYPVDDKITVEGLSVQTEYRCSVVTKYNQLQSSPESFIVTTEQWPSPRIYKPIYNYAELSEIGNEGLAGNYILLRDIDLENEIWTPIGNSTDKFTGVFEGAGHVIKNLSINDPNASYVGLFGYISGSGTSDKGEIRNLGVVDCKIEAKQFAGGLAGYSMSGRISNCYVTGSIKGSNSVTVNGYIGGLAGYVNGSTIANSSADCTVFWVGGASNEGYIGGLVGVIYSNSSITSCFAKGSVTSNGNYTGGLAGDLTGSAVKKSYSLSAVTGVNHVGGLIGNMQYGNPSTSIEDCYAHGNVSGDTYVGGLVGQKDLSSSIKYCYSIGSVAYLVNSGGLVGSTNSSLITGSYYFQDPDNSSGAKKTENEMKLEGTYTGWGFGTIWGISSTVNGGFPYLR
ncbi:MAG: hypothetical protein JXK07_15880 [Spirochaetes bacterium]|nr:hypothetical protein [Spirochaetota bacterium]